MKWGSCKSWAAQLVIPHRGVTILIQPVINRNIYIYSEHHLILAIYESYIKELKGINIVIYISANKVSVMLCYVYQAPRKYF